MPMKLRAWLKAAAALLGANSPQSRSRFDRTLFKLLAHLFYRLTL